LLRHLTVRLQRETY